MAEEFEKPKMTGYTIYSKSGCPNCIKVKKFLQNAKTQMNVVDCDDYLIENKEEFLTFIEKIAEKPVRVFPIVFFERKLVEDTEYHYNRLNAFENNDLF